LSRDVRQAIAGCASLTSAFDSKRPADRAKSCGTFIFVADDACSL
jgi:hypothetical protein